MSSDLFFLLTLLLVLLVFLIIGLLGGALLLRRQVFPLSYEAQEQSSPPASVTGQRYLSDTTPRAPPVAGDGGETG